jgi:hypothetical protein
MRKTTVIIILFFFIKELYSQHAADGIAVQNKFQKDKGFWQEFFRIQIKVLHLQ